MQLCFHETLLNPFGVMHKLNLGPFNLSLCMFPFPFYPQHDTAPSDVLFPGNGPTLFPLLLQSQLSHPALWPLHLLGFTIRSSFVPLAGRGPCSAEMSNVKGVLMQLWPACTLTHPDGWKWLEGGQAKRKKHSQKKGMNTECAPDLQEVNTGAIMLINQ